MFKKYSPFFKGLNFDTFVDLCGGTGITSVWINKNYPNKDIILNEYNVDIYNIYYHLKYKYEEFIRWINTLEEEYMEKDLPERKEMYLQKREKYHEGYHTLPPLYKTALLYFLMCTNFNGIWQAKKSTGIYYTPFGNGGEKNGIYNRTAIKDFKEMVDKATILCGSYENVPVPNNSLIFADPPYINSFTRYDDRIAFEETMQLQMANYLIDLSDNNLFAFCNKDHIMFREVFSKFNFETFDVKYTASRKDTKAASATEILVHNFRRENV